MDASTGEKLQDRKLSLSGVEGENSQCMQLLSPQNNYFWFADEKCSTDADCKKNCAREGVKVK